MDHNFSSVCNCLYSLDNLSQDKIDKMSSIVNSIGVPLNTNTIISSVERVGNWVGGRVYLNSELIVFSPNALNRQFQIDEGDLVIPLSLVSNPRLGRMMYLFKTVDCDVLGNVLRFRCYGNSNDQLLNSLKNSIHL